MKSVWQWDNSWILLDPEGPGSNITSLSNSIIVEMNERKWENVTLKQLQWFFLLHHVIHDRKCFHEAVILVTQQRVSGLVVNSVLSARPTETWVHPCSSDGDGWIESTRPAQHKHHHLLLTFLLLNSSLRHLLSSWQPYSHLSLYERLRLECEIIKTSPSEQRPQSIWNNLGMKIQFQFRCPSALNPIQDETETKAPPLKPTFVRNSPVSSCVGSDASCLNQNLYFQFGFVTASAEFLEMMRPSTGLTRDWVLRGSRVGLFKHLSR